MLATDLTTRKGNSMSDLAEVTVPSGCTNWSTSPIRLAFDALTFFPVSIMSSESGRPICSTITLL